MKESASRENREPYDDIQHRGITMDEMREAIRETQQALINEYGHHRAAVNFPKLMSIKID